MILRPLAAVALACLAAAACSGGGSEKTPPASAAAQPPATTAAAAAPAGAAEFGVPECDEYINKYLACIDSKVPEAGRAMARQSLDQTKAQWKQVAATPGGKAGLATGCKAATDAARTSMAAYGCSF
jgi:hypothetical protein